jgi:pimeloyl-ACP methyl ester carboxylesterase
MFLAEKPNFPNDFHTAFGFRPDYKGLGIFVYRSEKHKKWYVIQLSNKGLKDVILLGNSLGGHVSLLFARDYPDLAKGLVLTGSSGLYENNMGDGYPKRGNYDYIKEKSQAVFYDPKVASKEIVDEVFEAVNDRNKLIRTLALAKSAIRHNMASELPSMLTPTAIIWGAQDSVTPPNVAIEFDKLLPNSTLYWIDHCGHAPMMEHPIQFNKVLSQWLVNSNF